MPQQYYYIYIHAYPSTHPEKPNQIFYVGKGCKKRFLDKSRKNSPYLQNILNKLLHNGYVMKDIAFIIKDNLSEPIAFKEEIKLIKELGRLNKKTGDLVNLTAGGEGAALSQETKDKIGKSHAFACLNFRLLNDFYINQKLTLKEIGKIFTVSSATVSKWLVNLNIVIRNRPRIKNIITKKEIEELYVIQKLSMNYISKELKISISSVRCILKRNNIPIRYNKYLLKDILDKKQLIELYTIKKLTIKEICNTINSCKSHVSKSLKYHNIPTRSGSEAQIHAIKKPTKDKLIELYATQKLTIEETAKICNVCTSTVFGWLRFYSIHIRSRSEAAKLWHSQKLNM